MSTNSKWQLKFSTDFAQKADRIDAMSQKIQAVQKRKHAHVEQLRVDLRNTNIKRNHTRQKHSQLRNNQTPSRK